MMMGQNTNFEVKVMWNNEVETSSNSLRVSSSTTSTEPPSEKYCGNGFCDKGENVRKCPQDC